MSQEQGISFVWSLVDKITKPLEAVSKIEKNLRDSLGISQSEIGKAAKKRKQLYKEETQDLQELKRMRHTANSIEEITLYNKRIEETAERIKTLKSVSVGIPGALDRMTSPINRMFSGIKGNIMRIAGAYLSYKGIVASTKAYDVQAKAEAQLRSSLESTGAIAGKTFDQLTKKASEFQSKTLFGDEKIIEAQSVLLTFTNIWDDTFDNATAAALDMSAKLGQDLQSSIIQVGKALNDPIQGITALSRANVSFTEEQKKSIKSLTEAGRIQEAQQMILNELNKKFGGSAEAAAKDGLGPWQQLQNTLGDIQEAFGKLIVNISKDFLPIAKRFAGFLEKVADYSNNNSEQLSKFLKVLGVFAGLMAGLIVAWKIYTVVQTIANTTMWGNPIGQIILGITALIAAIAVAIIYWEDIIGWLKEFGHWLLFLTGPIGIIAALLIEYWDEVKSFFIKTGNQILDFIDSIIPGFKESFLDFKDWLFGWISDIWNALTGWWNDLMDYFGFDDKKEIDIKINADTSSFDDFVTEWQNADANMKKEMAKKLGAKYGQEFSVKDVDKYVKDYTESKKRGITVSQYRDLENKRGGRTSPISAGLSSVTEAGKSDVRNNNIRIESLIKSLVIQSNNLDEATEEVRDKIARALIDAVRDTEIALS